MVRVLFVHEVLIHNSRKDNTDQRYYHMYVKTWTEKEGRTIVFVRVPDTLKITPRT